MNVATAAPREKPTRSNRCLPPAPAAATTRSAKSDTLVHLPSQYQRPVQHSLGESQDGASSAVLLPETSLLTVLMYRVGALPVPLLHCSVAAFLVPRGRSRSTHL